MSQRSAVGGNPLDDMIPISKVVSKSKKELLIKPARSVLKERMTVQISKEIVEWAKNAVYWSPGLTIAQLTEKALIEALKKLEKRNGKSFQNRKSELKPGRPVK